MGASLRQHAECVALICSLTEQTNSNVCAAGVSQAVEHINAAIAPALVGQVKN